MPAGGTVREKDGRKFVLSYQTSINPLHQNVQTIIKQNLADVGIEAQIKAVEAGVFFSTDTGNPDTNSKFWADIQMYANTLTSPDPTSDFDGFTCAKVNARANNWQLGNDGRYCNPEFDATFKQALQEVDPAKRRELFVQLNDILVNDVAIIPLVERRTPHGKAKELKGPTGSSFDSQTWNIATWSK